MPLSQADMQKVLRHLASSPRPGCHACGALDLTVGKELVGILEVLPNGDPVPGNFKMPMVQIICLPCGYVMHFSAKIVGLLP